MIRLTNPDLFKVQRAGNSLGDFNDRAFADQPVNIFKIGVNKAVLVHKADLLADKIVYSLCGRSLLLRLDEINSLQRGDQLDRKSVV